MIAKAARDTSRPLGLRARVLRIISAPLAAIRARREAAAAEDAADLALVEEILARNEPTIPHEEVMRELGLR
jgi:hypothetical protein